MKLHLFGARPFETGRRNGGTRGPSGRAHGRNRAFSWTASTAAAGLLLFSGCSPAPEPSSARAAAPVAVQTKKLEMERHPVRHEVSGTVRAKLRAVIEANVAGRIARQPVALGQHLQAGDLIAELDAQEIQASLAQAEAMLRQAGGDLARYTELLKREAVTRAEFDAVESKERAASAAVDQARTMAGYTRIHAPFDGVISRKFLDVGELAAPGCPMVELENTNQLQFDVYLPESALGKIEPGSSWPLEIGAAQLEGIVREVSPVADPGSRTFAVQFDLPPDAALRPGQFGRVHVEVGEREALRIDRRAIRTRGQLEQVFVLQDGQAVLRLIKTGRAAGGEVEVLAGLAAGETLIMDSAQPLADGQPVIIENP